MEECPICLESFNYPVSLLYGHNFCGECLSSYIHENKLEQEGLCPVCREKFSTKKHKIKWITFKIDEIGYFNEKQLWKHEKY